VKREKEIADHGPEKTWDRAKRFAGKTGSLRGELCKKGEKKREGKERKKTKPKDVRCMKGRTKEHPQQTRGKGN